MISSRVKQTYVDVTIEDGSFSYDFSINTSREEEINEVKELLFDCYDQEKDNIITLIKEIMETWYIEKEEL